MESACTDTSACTRACIRDGGRGGICHSLADSFDSVTCCFALAAILSPTDAVAVGAMAGRVHLPKGIHRLLEGEALMNDASGLVAFKFAIAATVTGVFSWRMQPSVLF